MMRVALCADESLHRQLASRLHEATLVAHSAGTHDAEALVSCLPFPAAADTALAWLARGEPVLVVSDAAPTSEALAALIEAARPSGAPLMVGNLERWKPSRRLIREQLQSGKLGEPGLLRSHAWEAHAPATAEQGEILSAALARHLDLALWLVDKPLARLFAVGQASPAQNEGSMAGANVHLAFSGGAMALVGYALFPARGSYSTLSVIGSAGAAYADDQQNVQLLLRELPQAVAIDEKATALAALVQAFVYGLFNGNDFASTAQDWQKALDLAREARRSLESGQAVSWEER